MLQLKIKYNSWLQFQPDNRYMETILSLVEAVCCDNDLTASWATEVTFNQINSYLEPRKKGAILYILNLQ